MEFPELAIDIKHVRIQSQSKSGSLFHSYKDYIFIVLLATLDANYKFVAVDIGSFGKEDDSSYFFKSNMGKQILNGTFKFPEHCNLPGSNILALHVIIGDEAFHLHKYIMKLYKRKSSKENSAESVINDRLQVKSRTKSHQKCFWVIEPNFYDFYQPINFEVTTIDDLV